MQAAEEEKSAAIPPRPPNPMFNLGDISSAKGGLKKTETRVRTRDGKVFVEKNAGAGDGTREYVGEAEKPQYQKDQEDGRSPLQPKIFADGEWRVLNENAMAACEGGSSGSSSTPKCVESEMMAEHDLELQAVREAKPSWIVKHSNFCDTAWVTDY